MDPHLVYRIEKPGRYIAMVRDAQFRGDASFVYRVTPEGCGAGLQRKTIGTDDTFYCGRTNSLLVGSGGWRAGMRR